MNRIVLVRHGETVGESSIRYYGSTDVPLSDRGRDQMRVAARSLPGDAFGVVVTSPLVRAWKSARIVAPRAAIRLDEDLREIDFGAWEGLSAEEIEARDPIRYRDWREGRPGFEFPGGERRAHFRARVDRGVDRILAAGVASALAVIHKGVIRAIAHRLAGRELAPELPEVGGIVQLTRSAGGDWFVGRHSSASPELQSTGFAGPSRF